MNDVKTAKRERKKWQLGVDCHYFLLSFWPRCVVHSNGQVLQQESATPRLPPQLYPKLLNEIPRIRTQDTTCLYSYWHEGMSAGQAVILALLSLFHTLLTSMQIFSRKLLLYVRLVLKNDLFLTVR